LPSLIGNCKLDRTNQYFVRTIQSQDIDMKTRPNRTYTSLEAAYGHFNRKLFAGTLPPCLITMQRHKGAYGYFSGNRFASLADPEEVTDEIALNPAHFARQTPTEILSTLAHEMAHLWQHHFGKPGRRGYHNKQWAAKMHEIGLIPSDTAQPGGKETGERVSHYIAEDGRFAAACTALLANGAAILYRDRAGDGGDAKTKKKKAASKTRYTCPACQANAWAKPDTKLICGDCEEPMPPEDLGGGGEDMSF
jgi:predicted SprT family Zn-dependent metalloprotease